MEERKHRVWEGTVLTILNRHIEECGNPPNLGTQGCYTAYFENDYGEQLVFQYDYQTKKGTLWHGDCGWEVPIPVMGGGTTITLSEEEKEWLRLVWRVATRRETKEFQIRSTLDLVNAHKAEMDEVLACPEIGITFKREIPKLRKKLEKQEKSLLDELEKTKAIQEAERIIHEGE